MPRIILGLFILLLVPIFGQAQGDALLLQVGNEKVYKSEFEYYYRRSGVTDIQEFLSYFLDFKRKVSYAKEMGLDTLSAFRQQDAYYRNMIEFPQGDTGGKKPIESRFVRKEEWVKLAHITRLLPQQVSRWTVATEQKLMDSIRVQLIPSSNFHELAKQYSTSAPGLLAQTEWPWMPAYCFLAEWQQEWQHLSEGEVSRVFCSPLGIHIIKCLGKKIYDSSSQSKPAVFDVEAYQWKQKEITEGLLAALVTQRYSNVSVNFTEAALDAYFREHKSDYAWDLPHYLGAVIHCKNKKEAKAIKKCLKKQSLEKWEELFQKMVVTLAPKPTMEFGLFQIGKNAYIDKLVFKCGDLNLEEEATCTFVMGEKLKKGPKDYLDVREQVIADYRKMRKQSLIEFLREKYETEIDEEVLKTVNNHTCN